MKVSVSFILSLVFLSVFSSLVSLGLTSAADSAFIAYNLVGLHVVAFLFSFIVTTFAVIVVEDI